MTSDDSRTASPLGDLTWVALLAVVATIATVGAFLHFGKAPARGCAASGRRDPAYAVRLQGPVQTSVATYLLSVTRSAHPVTGAQVCFAGAMEGMSAMGVSNGAPEVSPGVYRLAATFTMSGMWSGTVLISETGHPTVAVRLMFPVT